MRRSPSRTTPRRFEFSQFGSGVARSPPGGTHFFQSGEAMGWKFLMFDPTYGGDSGNDHPPTTIYWDLDELYVSTK